jgi:hypothetical protein
MEDKEEEPQPVAEAPTVEKRERRQSAVSENSATGAARRQSMDKEETKGAAEGEEIDNEKYFS